VQWVTGIVLCDEEHTITQILTAIGLVSRWRVLESFAEYGSWDREAVERELMRTIGEHQPCRWGKYRVMAVDDAKEHHTSAEVWGKCTFHESTARKRGGLCPNGIPVRGIHSSSICDDSSGTTVTGFQSSWFAWKRWENLPRPISRAAERPPGQRS
jgi:hypothetical protein